MVDLAHLVACYEIALAALLVMAGLSLFASQRFRDHPKLPMQWGLNGRPTWAAPRWLALTFTPLLAAFVLNAVVLAAGPTPSGIPALALASLSFIGVHVLHLWLIEKTLR